MRLFLILMITLFISKHFSLLDESASFAKSMQKNCAELFPKELNNRELAQSFVCGTPLSDWKTKRLFQETSLLHLMVVSGSHLQLISFFLFLPLPKKWQKKKTVLWIMSFVLLSYCFVTGFQAPVIRAYASKLLSSVNTYFRWHWDSGKVQILAGLSLLCIFPIWILNLSFFLSWLASLGFLLAPLSIRNPHSFKAKIFAAWLNSSMIQVFLYLCFSSFSLLGVAVNALLAPVISLFLFPLSISALIFPRAIPWVDRGWNFLLEILTMISSLSSGGSTQLKFGFSLFHWLFLWGSLALIHSAFYLLRQSRYRGSNV